MDNVKALCDRCLRFLETPVLGNHAGAWAVAFLVGIVTFVAVRAVLGATKRRRSSRAGSWASWRRFWAGSR
jgi:hypothetical protein